jgi:hypothetical protein
MGFKLKSAKLVLYPQKSVLACLYSSLGKLIYMKNFIQLGPAILGLTRIATTGAVDKYASNCAMYKGPVK